VHAEEAKSARPACTASVSRWSMPRVWRKVRQRFGAIVKSAIT
jgi:hypothetical protein